MLDQPLSERLRAARESKAASEAEETSPTPPARAHRMPLGVLLVEKGAVSEADVAIALQQQRHDNRPLGQILLEMGAVTQRELARTLTEQHGFDFNASLRRRIAPGDEEIPAEAADDPAPPVPRSSERYVVRESSAGAPLHVADSFLDAADAAFELIEERDPEQLEIVRPSDGDFEQLWSYRRDDAGASPA
jgi:hypothetical protein